jgi:hypothetical protein
VVSSDLRVLGRGSNAQQRRSRGEREHLTARQESSYLSISAYTVQEQLTAIFDNVGVRSRGELVGQVFLRYCLPAILD